MNQDLEQPTFKRSGQTIRKEIMNMTAFQHRPTTSPLKTKPPQLISPSKNQQSQPNTSTDRNMKFKLDQLQNKLADMLHEVRSCREEYRELLDRTSLIKNSFVYEDLLNLKVEMEGRMLSFSQHIRQRRETDDQRYGQVRGNCKELWNKTEQLRQQIFQLQLRVEKVEQKLGFKEIYRLEQF